MAHLATQIIDWVADRVSNLPTTGSNVSRNRFYRFPSAVAVGLSIYSGPEGKVDPRKQRLVDAEFTVLLVAHVREGWANDIDSALQQIRKEVNLALIAAPCPEFIMSYWEDSLPEIFIDEGGSKPTAYLTIPWVFKYRRLIDNPEAWS